MVVATAEIGDFDRFWKVWAIFDWDQAGWESFTSDPETPGIFAEAGFTAGPPKSADFLREHYA